MDLVRLAATEPVVPPLDSSATEVWRDADGRVCAVGYPSPPGHSLFVPGIGTFRFETSSEVIVLEPLPWVDDDLVDDAYHRIAMPLALQYGGCEVLHASGVLFPEGVVALGGGAGLGKSTLAYGLSRRGHPLCADDAVAVDNSQKAPTVLPLPFRMRLRPASAGWFSAPSLLKGRNRRDPWSQGRPARFLALFLLDRPEDAPHGTVEVERLMPADAFTAALPHAYYVVLDDEERNRRLITSYLDLAERVPVFALRYHPTLDAVDRIISAIEREVACL